MKQETKPTYHELEIIVENALQYTSEIGGVPTRQEWFDAFTQYVAAELRLEEQLKQEPTPKEGEPVLIKAGSNLIRLGENCSQPPKVDCRLLAEDYYQKLVRRAELGEQHKVEVQKLIDSWQAEVDAVSKAIDDGIRGARAGKKQCISELKDLL